MGRLDLRGKDLIRARRRVTVSQATEDLKHPRGFQLDLVQKRGNREEPP